MVFKLLLMEIRNEDFLKRLCWSAFHGDLSANDNNCTQELYQIIFLQATDFENRKFQC